MDAGNKPLKVIGGTSSKAYMDLREIVREHAIAFLPAKSLFRFTAVCRDWKLKILAPFFAHNQTNSFRTISGLFCQTYGASPSFISVDQESCGVPDPSLKFFPEDVDIRTSSNGLLCCQGRSGDRSYYICNPVTKQLKKLPKPNANHGPEPAILLIFEPSVYSFVADYKLICAFPSADFDDAYEFEIYSSALGSWKISGEIFFSNKKIEPSSGAHVNGVAYWKIRTGGFIAFDLGKERSQLISMVSGSGLTLGVMSKKLCVAGVSQKNLLVVYSLSNVFSNTMEMKNRARAWEVIYQIPLDNSITQHPVRSAIFAGDNMVLLQSEGNIMSLDLRSQKLSILHDKVAYGMNFVPYVNSLVYF